MKRQIFILLLLIAFIGCRYYEPEGIVDKTEDYIKAKKSWTKLEDKVSVDGYTRIGDSIFGGEIACNIKPLENIDVETFEVLPGTKYARDKNHIYYPWGVPCICYFNCGVCFYSGIIIKDANPKTFKYLGNGYASDRQKAFFRGELIENADGLSFKVIKGPEFFYFAVDSNNVYRHNQIFKEADPLTFYYDSINERNNPKLGRIIISDKEHEWQYTPPTTIEEIKRK
jgi:hypothetical protein